MEAKELRIGSWVYDDGVAHNSQVGNRQITENETPQTRCYLKPIPLTEEWLIKLDYYKKDDYYRLYIDELSYLNCWFNSSGDFIVNMINGFVHIEHVHSLQNLYFALTGEEL